MENETGYILPKPDDTLWQFAFDNAILVRDALVRAAQLVEDDEQAAIESVRDALGSLAKLRSRAPESSALLAAVLFFGIELEVRLTSVTADVGKDFGQVVKSEIERTEKLIAAIQRHMSNKG